MSKLLEVNEDFGWIFDENRRSEGIELLRGRRLLARCEDEIFRREEERMRKGKRGLKQLGLMLTRSSTPVNNDAGSTQ